MTGDRKHHGEDLGAPTTPRLGFATPTAPPWHGRALRPPAAPEACGLHPASVAQPPGLLPKILLPSSPPPSRPPSHGPAAEPAPLAGLRSRCVTRPRRTSLLGCPSPGRGGGRILQQDARLRPSEDREPAGRGPARLAGAESKQPSEGEASRAPAAGCSPQRVLSARQEPRRREEVEPPEPLRNHAEGREPTSLGQHCRVQNNRGLLPAAKRGRSPPPSIPGPRRTGAGQGEPPRCSSPQDPTPIGEATLLRAVPGSPSSEFAPDSAGTNPPR